MKHTFLKALLYNLIAALLIVNLDFTYTNKILQFNEKIPIVILTFILIFIDIIIALVLIFFLLKLFKVNHISLPNITRNLINKFSFISLVCTSLNLLLCNFSDNIILANHISTMTNVILYAWIILKFIKEVNLSKILKCIIVILFVIPFLFRRWLQFTLISQTRVTDNEWRQQNWTAPLSVTKSINFKDFEKIFKIYMLIW